MPKTTKLQLPIVTDDSTLFEDWRKSINGNNIDSAFQIIDDFAVEVYEALSSGGGGLTPEQEAKLNLIKDNGVGDKYLADDGTYKVVSGGGGGGIDLNMLGYMNYAADIFYRGKRQSLFANAWGHSLTVTPSEISVDSSSGNPKGIAQYPNGENEGVIIPQGVTNIGTYVFSNWSANTHPLVIPNSVTSINDSAFAYWTSNNQPLTIPNSVTSIGGYAFRNWTSNTHPLVIPDSVTSIGDSVFWNWTSNNQPLVIPDSVTSIGDSAFRYWEANTHPLVIPNSVTSIGTNAFQRWKANTHPLVIPDSVTNIGGYAFQNWEANNQPLVIPDSVTSIGTYAFSNWTSNNQPLVIPDSVTSIGGSAFRYWEANTHPLVIPDSVTSIGTNAFQNWQLVPYVEIQAITPPSLSSINAFANQNDAPIYVPDGSVDDYKEATNWVSLASRIFSINDK